jgi:RNA polymerase sigma-32 factor
MLGRDEEIRLARSARAGDQRAFDRLIHAHMPLVHSIAWQYRSYGSPREDLLSEALLGLVKATRAFDSERGVRLATYAALWIRAYLRRYTLDNRRIVRGPSTRNARKVLAGLRRAERTLAPLGETPDAEAVARTLGVEVRDVEDVRTLLGARDIPNSREADGSGFKTPSGEPSPEALAAQAEQQRLARELVQDALTGLDPRPRAVIERRCLDAEPRSLAAVGKELGLSHEAVRLTELRAKAAMRAAITGTMLARGMGKEDLCRAWDA